MIVEELTSNGNHTYTVVVGKEKFLFDEEVILEYRLVKGKEISNEILQLAQKKNDRMDYYHKAYNYAIRYGKNQAQVYDYLKDKGLCNSDIAQIIDDLKKIKVLDDEKLIFSLTDSLVRKGNGRLCIERKLYDRQFSQDLIASALNQIDETAYFDALERLYQKSLSKYKDEPYIKKMKIKKYLLSRGYTYSDISRLNMD